LLQRHHDGELDDADIERVGTHLASCAACTKREAVLDRLHTLITMSSEDRASDVSLDGMFERIEAGIAAQERQEAAGTSPAKVVSLASYRRVVPAVAAFAVAAAVLLMVTVKQTNKGRVGATPDAPEAERSESKTAEVNVAPGRSEVLQVDFGSNGVPDVLVPASGCTSDRQCPGGGICQAGRCIIAAQCVTNADCTADMQCTTDGRCVSPPAGPCATTADCNGLVCQGRQCVACTPGAGGGQCATGQVCAPDGRCIVDQGAAGGGAPPGEGGLQLGPDESVKGGACHCTLPVRAPSSRAPALLGLGLVLLLLRRRSQGHR
jgi:hypothetical protein